MYTYIIFACLMVFIFIFYGLAKNNKKIRGKFSYFAAFILILYIIWRGFFTLPLNSIPSSVAGILLYVSEVIGLLVYMFFIVLFHQEDKEEEEKQEELSVDETFMPSVAVFVCTYNEDINLVVSTALAVRSLKYPNKEIYICDDGHRDYLRLSCEYLGIHYLSREGNEHAKAGNINYALSQTQSDLFMVLDADFIVKKNFIYEAIPHFKDENVALVQYPQTFYNKDVFQLVRHELYNEQELFMRFLEPQLAKENALIHIGTNAILRRSAVEAIGGFPTKSITEDMATGLLLQSHGYQTKYINKAYALGVAPYTVKDLAGQRRRWAKGTVQIFHNYKPRKQKGLSLKQKLCYYNAYLYWFTSFQKIVYILAPTIFMVFDVFVVRSDLSNLLLFFIPPILMIMLAFRLYIPKVRTLTTSHIYDSFVAPIHAGAIIKEFFVSETKFKVTKKNVKTKKGTDFKTVRVHIVLALWLLVALAIAIYKIWDQSIYMFGYIVTALWTVYNLYGLGYAIIAAKRREIMSDADALSITINEDVSIEDCVYNVNQMSYNGFHLQRIKNGKYFIFEIDGRYDLQIVRTGLIVNARCLEIHKDYVLFRFDNLTVDAANRIASYYSDQLHAARPLDFDLE